MKKLLFFVFISLFCLYSHSLLAQPIQIDCAGKVGIARAPGSQDLVVDYSLLSPRIASSQLNTGHITRGGGYGDIDLSSGSNILSIYGTPYNANAMNISQGSASNAAAVFNGKVEINNGELWINNDNTVHFSDLRLKKDISTLDGLGLLRKFEKVDARNYKFRNREEIMQLQQSGEVNFQTDTINILAECETAFYLDGKSDKAKYRALYHVDVRQYKQEILKLYKNEVLKKYNFDEIIDDTLGVIISIPDYDDTKYHFGFIAQEVMEEFPELVAYDKTRKIYGVNYVNFVPILFEAIKAQQQQIEILQALVSAQETDIIELKNKDLKSATIGNDVQGKTELFQNTPNPFNQSTNIKYYLENDVTDAFITVCNLNGTQLKSIAIPQTGEGSVTIDRETLQPGIYLYALIADGQLIDTKKMVMTD